jgi:hypothetical protein
MPETFTTTEVGTAVQPCQSGPEPTPSHWIELEMIGEDDQPIPWEEYEVTLPGGEKVSGYLDDRGWARIDNIDKAGSCRICFPMLDQEAWVATSDSALTGRSDAL